MFGTESDSPNQDSRAIAAVLASLYPELRRIAAAQMSRSDAAPTLQPTALVHEAWLRLTANDRAEWRDQSHFIAAAAEAMRHILIDRARRRRAVRHGGGQRHVDIGQVELPTLIADDATLLVLDMAMRRLADRHPEPAALIELYCFGGLDIPEAARVLGLSRSTAYRRWRFAEAWLRKELASSPWL